MNQNEIQEDVQNKKVFLKRWFGVFILIIVAVLVTLGLLNLNGVINFVQDKYAAFKYNQYVNKLEAPYRNDKYGGKTPEETFDLFIAALKKGDIDLASKYFVIPKQESWRKTLDVYKNQGLISEFLLEQENNKSNWVKSNQSISNNLQEFTYVANLNKDMTVELNGKKVILKAGKYRNSITFERYPGGNWKISLL